MATFETLGAYMACSENAQVRLARIQQIIELLETKAIESVGNMDIEEYSLNDGQIIIKTVYRDVGAIAEDIGKFQKVYDMIFNRCSGTRIVSLRDAQAYNLNR